MSSRVIGQVISADGRSNQGPTVGSRLERKGPMRHDTPLSPRLSPSEKEDREAAQILDAGCGAYGTNREAAEFLDLDESMLIKMRQGLKSCPLRVLWRLLPIERCALAMSEVEARIANTSPMQPLRKVTREECDPEVARQVRRTVDIWQLYRKRVADALGTTEEDVEAAYAGGGGK
jgi:hypothetical protein